MPLSVRRWRSSKTAEQPKESLFSKRDVFSPSYKHFSESRMDKRQRDGRTGPATGGREKDRRLAWNRIKDKPCMFLSLACVLCLRSDPRPTSEFASRQPPDLTPKLCI